MNRCLPFLLAFTLAGARALHADTAPLEAPVAQNANAAPVAAADAPSPNIRIEIQVVAIPEQLAPALIAEMKNKDQIEAANTKIQDMLAKGTAKLIGWPIVTTRSGQRAVIEGIREIRYATEYTPPTVGVSTDVPADKTIKVEPKVDVTTLDGIPTAFETRNAGITLEVEPVLAPDGKKIDLNMVPQHVRLKGYEKVTIEGASRKGKVIVEQPQFDTMKVNTSMTMLSGRRMLLGVFRTDDPPKHFEFF
ncbi:MAG TPA: hypothetical protein VK961_07945, partial [Chthoniobacter sp.]|nr:hypothetical protein [Chthoniobacter sp.]